MAAGIRKVKFGKRMMPGNSVKQRIQDFGTEKTSIVHGYWDVCDVCSSWTVLFLESPLQYNICIKIHLHLPIKYKLCPYFFFGNSFIILLLKLFLFPVVYYILKL